jgi:hypothetical protein
MRCITRFILAVLAVLVARAGLAAGPASHCPPPQSDQLVGLWESESRSQGGIGHAIEFRSDGSMAESPTVLVDSYYRVSGDRLIIGERPNPEPGDETTSWPLRLEGNSMIPERSGVTAERVSSPVPGQLSLLGVWRTPFPAGGMAYERYTSEGRLYFRLPMRPSKGCYEFDGTKLTLTIEARKTSSAVELRGDDLSLKSPHGDAARYHREPAGPWYALERIDDNPKKERK